MRFIALILVCIIIFAGVLIQRNVERNEITSFRPAILPTPNKLPPVLITAPLALEVPAQVGNLSTRPISQALLQEHLKKKKKYRALQKKDPCALPPSSLTGIAHVDLGYEKALKRKSRGKFFAQRFACFWEKERFQELYELFSERLREERDLQSFIGIMNYRKTIKMQPFSVRITKVSFFENATVGHVYYQTDYIVSRSSHKRRKEPIYTIRFVNDSWVFDDMDELFLTYCNIKNDCRISASCKAACEAKGFQAETFCGPITQKCSCFCNTGEGEELSFYSLIYNN